MATQEFEKLKIKIEKRPCHICGSQEFEWGYVDSSYQPALFTTKYDQRRHILASRKCLRCNNVQMFADKQSTQKVWRWGCWLAIVVLVISVLPLCQLIISFFQTIWMIATGQAPVNDIQLFP